MLQYLIKFLFILALITAPLQTIQAIGQHYELEQLKTDNFLISASGNFKLKLPTEQDQSLDAYIFELPNTDLPENFQAVSPIYSYYLYSAEETDKAVLELTFSFKDNLGKTVYWFNEKANRWQIVQPMSFTANSLTVQLSGKSQQLFLGQAAAIIGTTQQIVAQDDRLAVNLPKALSGQLTTTTIELLANLEGGEPAKRLSGIYYLDLVSGVDLNKIFKEASQSSCEPYLTKPLTLKKKNPLAEVKKLQEFLKEVGFTKVKINGAYDSVTAQAVKGFQESYAADILTPLGLKLGTGNVREATLNKINELACEQAKRAGMIKLSFKYSLPGNQAKSFYQWENGLWQKINSVDNWHSQTITALISQPSAKIALFEEPSAWVGEASWYAWKNGDFAASRDWPKGAKLKVTNQSESKNQGKSVIVTINDYGPEEWTKRIIDLDKAAFAKIGNVRGGILPVKIEAIN